MNIGSKRLFRKKKHNRWLAPEQVYWIPAEPMGYCIAVPNTPQEARNFKDHGCGEYIEGWPGSGKSAKRIKYYKLKFLRDHPYCHYCNKELDYSDSTIDHKVAKSKGGLSVESNLLLSCETCNNRKKSMSYDDFIRGMKMFQLNDDRLGRLNGIYVEIPESQTEDESIKAVSAATTFVLSLLKNDRIQFLGEKNKRATHAIAVDSQGNHVLKRLQFSLR